MPQKKTVQWKRRIDQLEFRLNMSCIQQNFSGWLARAYEKHNNEESISRDTQVHSWQSSIHMSHGQAIHVSHLQSSSRIWMHLHFMHFPSLDFYFWLFIFQIKARWFSFNQIKILSDGMLSSPLRPCAAPTSWSLQHVVAFKPWTCVLHFDSTACSCFARFSIHCRISLRRLIYLLIVTAWSDHWVMRCTRTVHMHRQELVSCFCVFAKPFEHGLECVVHYCTARHNLMMFFKRRFQGFCCKCLDDIVVLLVSLI